MTMSSYDKGSRELAAAWLRRGTVSDRRSRPDQASRRGEASRSTAKPVIGAAFHAETHASYSRT